MHVWTTVGNGNANGNRWKWVQFSLSAAFQRHSRCCAHFFETIKMHTTKIGKILTKFAHCFLLMHSFGSVAVDHNDKNATRRTCFALFLALQRTHKLSKPTFGMKEHCVCVNNWYMNVQQHERNAFHNIISFSALFFCLNRIKTPYTLVDAALSSLILQWRKNKIHSRTPEDGRSNFAS